uniref:glycosyltransferase family 4 protein n=1 Tax=Marinobacterium profundum TaxID=1714300 RepID=UPI00082E9533|nr:glycosyltransferase [Marinobacterium profundum]
MNIGIVTTWFERGAAYVSRQFFDRLNANESIDVFVYARGGESYAKGNMDWDAGYVTWGKPPKSYASTDVHLDDFKEWLEKNNIDCVLFNEQLIWAPVLMCRDLDVICGTYIDYYTEKTVPMFWIYDFIICNTQRHYSVFKEHSQCIYIPWGTDINTFKLPEILESSGVVRFFHSAGMNPYRKGTDLVIEAFRNVQGPAKLIVHSQVKLAKAFPALKGILAELTAQGRLEVIEGTVSAPGLYYKGDVYVYPSRLDGIGLTIAEAASSGLPIIVPDNPPMSEFVIDGSNGRAVRVDKLWSRWDGYYWPQCEVDRQELTDAMQYYVDKYPYMAEFKRISRQVAEENFNWFKNTEKLADTFLDFKRLSDSTVWDYRALAEKNDLNRVRNAMKGRIDRMRDSLKYFLQK